MLGVLKNLEICYRQISKCFNNSEVNYLTLLKLSGR
jgi:hypothetical protein